jgi:hypothetical protein
MNVGLGYSQDGTLITELPLGAIYNKNLINFYVEIFDNDDAHSIYNIPIDVQVLPNQHIIDEIKHRSNSRILYGGDTLLTIQKLLSVASMLNSESLSDKSAIQAICTALYFYFYLFIKLFFLLYSSFIFLLNAALFSIQF